MRDTLQALEKGGYVDQAGLLAGERLRDLRDISQGIRPGDNNGARAPYWMTGGPTAAAIDAEHAIRLIKTMLPIPTWVLLDQCAVENRSLRTIGFALGASHSEAGRMCGAALGELAKIADRVPGFWERARKRKDSV